MFERITRDDKMLLAFATQEAADLGHRRLGNDHLILGMLCNARSPLFTILADQGLTLASAREVVRKYHDEHADVADATDTDDESARQRYEEDREALRSIGIDLDKVREAVRGRFGEDLSDGWGDRPGRSVGRKGRPDGGRGRGRGHGRRHGHGHGHGPHRARGPRPDCGPEGFGPEGFGPGFGPEGPGGFGPSGFGPGPFGPGGPFAGDEGPWEPGRGRRGPRGRGSRPRFASETRSVFSRAVEIARERGDRLLRGEYLLLGIIDTADDASRTLIESATTADELKAAVWASLPEVDAEV
ncbi:Clp protease N-terminal domain-containing protein [Gordonia amicalis]|uniref:Clp protease N-terminal domain-containing protein n=1 Tax=Gordonia amicalis TaxID=89053 RepID=UPI0022A7868A|nr:Clp protease N-terminal domain-containing protein [Gordonia amicalis]MCZ0911752.1 Clp protease N-terminal domain-containing protein [Gordonia amicalis]MCZ4579284.1 Clp protease N-terminal domain-containing protein [Gordonia amicalis]